MRAIVLEQSKPVEESPLCLVELPTPEPGPGEIRIRAEAGGACHLASHGSAVSLGLRGEVALR
jgi:NADPH:quinone reductase-like Zn-dependent oxidoreductase